MEDAVNSIIDAIQYLSDKTASDMKRDRTVTGIIIANSGSNYYMVRIDGVEYSIPSSLPSSVIIYSINDVVLVTYFQNQNENAYITGKVVKK